MRGVWGETHNLTELLIIFLPGFAGDRHFFANIAGFGRFYPS